MSLKKMRAYVFLVFIRFAEWFNLILKYALFCPRETKQTKQNKTHNFEMVK